MDADILRRRQDRSPSNVSQGVEPYLIIWHNALWNTSNRHNSCSAIWILILIDRSLQATMADIVSVPSICLKFEQRTYVRRLASPYRQQSVSKPSSSSHICSRFQSFTSAFSFVPLTSDYVVAPGYSLHSGDGISTKCLYLWTNVHIRKQLHVQIWE